jgi:hypothetical protein
MRVGDPAARATATPLAQSIEFGAHGEVDPFGVSRHGLNRPRPGRRNMHRYLRLLAADEPADGAAHAFAEPNLLSAEETLECLQGDLEVPHRQPPAPDLGERGIALSEPE